MSKQKVIAVNKYTSSQYIIVRKTKSPLYVSVATKNGYPHYWTVLKRALKFVK